MIAAGETDWRKIVANLTGPIPNGRRIFYQKQMTHHFLPEVSTRLAARRDQLLPHSRPGEVIASYIKKNREPTVEDVGFVQQAEIFDFVRQPDRLDAAGDRCR